jgi:SNF2 family DNA or RNA helicase
MINLINDTYSKYVKATDDTPSMKRTLQMRFNFHIDALNDTDSKLEKIIQFIRKTKDTDTASKMVIFTEYRDTLNYLTAKLAQSYRVGNIDGTMNVEERNDALSEFRRPDGTEIMVCTNAAGEGIDMQFCNIEINYDLPWNPNKLEQRMGRIHRIGQDKPVHYYNFVISETVDGYILQKLLTKIEKHQGGNWG